MGPWWSYPKNRTPASSPVDVTGGYWITPVDAQQHPSEYFTLILRSPFRRTPVFYRPRLVVTSKTSKKLKRLEDSIRWKFQFVVDVNLSVKDGKKRTTDSNSNI